MLKILIVEDDFISRTILQEYLNQYGITHIAVNGKEALLAVENAMTTGAAYDLICLDVLMPEMTGQEALLQIRHLEKTHAIHSANAVKIMMVSALNDVKTVSAAFQGFCDAYLIKPIRQEKLKETLRNLNLLAP